jgi:hypothetical protein
MKRLIFAFVAVLIAPSGLAGDVPSMAARAGSYELLLPDGFAPGRAVEGQYVFVKSNPADGTTALVQLIFIGREEPRLEKVSEARQLRLDSFLYLFERQHQQFTAGKPEEVTTGTGSLLVSRWNGNKNGKPFAGYLAVAVIGDEVAVFTIMDTKENFGRSSGAYKKILESFRKAGNAS